MTDLTPKTYSEWLEEQLAKLRSRIEGISTGKASDARARAEVMASILEGLSEYLDWSIDQRFPDDANTTNLVRHAEIYEIYRKDPTTSEGRITVTGTVAAPVPIDEEFVDSEGNEGKTAEAAVIGSGGFVIMDAVSVDTGVAVNWAAGEEFSFSTAPPNIDEACEATIDFTGGTDQESPAALLARLLDRIRNPPAGGTESDWRQWAEAVDGVEHAFTHPQRRGTGTIDVSIVTLGVDGHLALPGAALLTAVETAVEAKRPVTTRDYEIISPAALSQAVTVNELEADEGIDPATLEEPIQEAAKDYYDTLETGWSLIWNDLHTAINSVAGVANFDLDTPADDVTATLDSATAQLIMPGTITVNAAS